MQEAGQTSHWIQLGLSQWALDGYGHKPPDLVDQAVKSPCDRWLSQLVILSSVSKDEIDMFQSDSPDSPVISPFLTFWNSAFLVKKTHQNGELEEFLAAKLPSFWGDGTYFTHLDAMGLKIACRPLFKIRISRVRHTIIGHVNTCSGSKQHLTHFKSKKKCPKPTGLPLNWHLLGASLATLFNLYAATCLICLVADPVKSKALAISTGRLSMSISFYIILYHCLRPKIPKPSRPSICWLPALLRWQRHKSLVFEGRKTQHHWTSSKQSPHIHNKKSNSHKQVTLSWWCICLIRAPMLVSTISEGFQKRILAPPVMKHERSIICRLSYMILYVLPIKNLSITL